MLVVDESVDDLERLRRDTRAPNISYLIGVIEVLPLTDSSVDEVLATAVLGADAAAECFRVLRPSGKVALAALDEEPTGQALNLGPREIERIFIDAGFASVNAADDRGRVVVLARKP